MSLKLTPKLALVFRPFAAAMLAGVVLLSYINGQRALKDAAGERQAALQGWIGEGAIFHVSLPANCLKACPRESDTVVRFGGDEFILIIEGVLDQADCLVVGQKILDAPSDPVCLEVEWLRFGASIGVSIFPNTARDSESLIKGADLGMYSAKQQGGRICFDQEGGQA